MDSFTSRSKSTVPWWTLQLLGVAVATWAAGAVYTLRLNPEVAFFRHADALKQEWMQHLSTPYTNKFAVFGGSSCLATVEPRQLLEQHGLPVVNLGLGAGMGAKILTRYALKAVRPGDTLIVALEPELLTGSIDLEPLGVQFALATGQSELLRNTSRIDWPAALVDLRPGGYHVLTLIGKILMRQPLYRYFHSEIEADGWQNVAARRELGTPAVLSFRLSAEARTWLAHIRDECARRNVRVAYSMPWRFTTQENLTASQRHNLLFLREVSQFLPVLREPALGSHAVREHFADTDLHLTAEGAALRTDELARTLGAWSLWTPEESNEKLAALRQADR